MPYPYPTKVEPYPGMFNTEVYDVTDFILFGGGCWLWVVAYGFIIYNIIKYKKLEMPSLVAAGNFAWEGFWAWYGLNDFGDVALYAYRAWFFLDIFIWISILRYGHHDTHHPLLAPRYKSYIVIATLLWLGFFYFLESMDLDTGIGAHSAYMLNFLISLCYVLNYAMLRKTDMVYSMWVAWLKLIGTGMNTVFMFKHYPEDGFLKYLGILIFIFDLWYAVWMTRDRLTGEVLAPSKRLKPA